MTTLDIMRAARESVVDGDTEGAIKALDMLIMDEEATQAAEQRARDIEAIKNRPERPYSVTVNESEKI